MAKMEALQQQESFTVEKPQLEALGQVESRLPKAAHSRATAVALCAVMVLVSLFGIGGAKMRGVYNNVRSTYNAVSEHGYTISSDLDKSADAAANVIRMCGDVLGPTNAEVKAAEEALKAWNATDAAHPAEQYTANAALLSRVDNVYQAAAAFGSSNMATIKTQYAVMTSQQDIIRREVIPYNQAAADYNKATGSFPAVLVGALWGADTVEAFA